MTVAEAQREVRDVYLHGAVGQLVSGMIWLTSAALGTWVGTKQAILALVVGGMFIFPLTQLALRLAGRPFSLGAANPLRHLAMQIAFIVPLTLPVAGAAALHNVNWFYPAVLVLVGAHYLPFVFLYGMGQYAVLAGAMLGGGVALGFAMPTAFTPGGWLGGTLLLAFAVWANALRRSGRAG